MVTLRWPKISDQHFASASSSASMNISTLVLAVLIHCYYHFKNIAWNIELWFSRISFWDFKLYRVSKKRVISKTMAITPLKSIRKGKSWCVSENSALMPQDRHHTVKFSAEMSKKNELEIDNLPLIMEQIYCSKFLPICQEGCQLQVFFLSHFSTIFERFGAYCLSWSWIFRNTTTFSLSDGFQSYGHVKKDSPFFRTPCKYLRSVWCTYCAGWCAAAGGPIKC